MLSFLVSKGFWTLQLSWDSELCVRCVCLCLRVSFMWLIMAMSEKGHKQHLLRSPLSWKGKCRWTVCALFSLWSEKCIQFRQMSQNTAYCSPPDLQMLFGNLIGFRRKKEKKCGTLFAIGLSKCSRNSGFVFVTVTQSVHSYNITERWSIYF